MFSKSKLVALALAVLTSEVLGLRVVLTNDDGWAVAQVRDQYAALKQAGFEVVLSAPAVNKSGTGSSTATPTALTAACEFNSCSAGSPPTGSNGSDPNINYVNAYPVDAARYGIQTLAPKLLGGAPDFVVSGTNVGSNLGSTVLISGTVGAASEAALLGVPSFAFSGASGSQVSYTTLTDTTASSTKTANVYTDLTLVFLNAILGHGGAILPPGISVNINFASTSSCSSAASYKWVATRINSNSSATDVSLCGTTHLPTESSAVSKGCVASISVFNASTKGDVDAATQAAVFNKLTSILTCL